MSAGPPSDESNTEEWDPTFPWERAADRATSTPRGRFVTYNVLLFLLVGTVSVLPGVLYYLTGGVGGSQSTITIGTSAEQQVFNGLYTTTVQASLLAVLSGVVAGLRFRSSADSVAVTGALGAMAGFAALLAMLFAVALLLGASMSAATPLRSLLHPVTAWAGAILAGGGAAYLTEAFVPERAAV